MHHLVIGEGQIGREIIARALEDGDTVTVLRRSEGDPAPGVRRVRGDVLDPDALAAALEGADAVQACFHAPYDARVWARDLPPRELAVLDAAAARDIPVVLPESMYGFQGGSRDLREGAAPSPLDAKGEVRIALLEQRRAHAARTLSIIAADLVGPTTMGTGASVACAMVIEPILAGRRPVLFGAPDVPHTLTFVPDLARAMLHAARHADRLTAPDDGDAVLHAPSAPARTQRELMTAASEMLDRADRRPWRIPRWSVRALSGVSTFARELAGISELWYAPCVLHPGVLTTEEGLAATPWEEALRRTADLPIAPVSTSECAAP
ncbi:NAD-dependent epimerase/dehydratase family protein [Brachybacterium sp. AOP43-C2-M15]|uniref:NAD-dependent epimerase/dehydratase family protein n=1 Tax=Brachybacterium sp. AOP43-C2-M15 TaxID=3457661 RepID=UPI004033574D